MFWIVWHCVVVAGRWAEGKTMEKNCAQKPTVKQFLVIGHGCITSRASVCTFCNQNSLCLPSKYVNYSRKFINYQETVALILQMDHKGLFFFFRHPFFSRLLFSDLSSLHFQDADAVCNLILSLVYYFCNLMPLSRGSRWVLSRNQPAGLVAHRATTQHSMGLKIDITVRYHDKVSRRAVFCSTCTGNLWGFFVVFMSRGQDVLLVRRSTLRLRLWHQYVTVFLLSVVAYSVVMGALMASGKEVIGRIPKGKVNTSTSLRCESLLCQR